MKSNAQESVREQNCSVATQQTLPRKCRPGNMERLLKTKIARLQAKSLSLLGYPASKVDHQVDTNTFLKLLVKQARILQRQIKNTMSFTPSSAGVADLGRQTSLA